MSKLILFAVVGLTGCAGMQMHPDNGASCGPDCHYEYLKCDGGILDGISESEGCEVTDTIISTEPLAVPEMQQ